MNRIELTVIATLLAVMLTACSADPPQVRVNNQRGDVVTVQLKRSSGNTYNINNVGAGARTGYIEVDPTTYEVDAKPENVSESATTHFTANEDESYTVVVLNTSPPTARVDRP